MATHLKTAHGHEGDPSGVANLARQIEHTGKGDHICLVYETFAEQMATVTTFLKAGLARGERCVYLVDDRTADAITEALEASGFDVAAEQARGAFQLLTKRDAYLRAGAFDPQAMVAFLGETEAKALADGYTGLCITGEMTWALGPETGCERLIEYETLLNDYFPGSRSSAICQYNRQRFPATITRDVLRTHPVVVVGDMVCRNLFFEPPAMVLGDDSVAGRVDWMIAQLQRARAAELARWESEERYRTLSETMPQLLWTADPSGRADYFNARWYEYTGVGAGESDGERWLESVHPDDLPHTVAAVLRSAAAGDPFEVQYRLRRHDGAYRWFMARAEAQRHHDGHVVRWIGTCTDIEAQKRAAELERSNAELQKLDRLKDEFISVVSHELRTPINAIMGFGSIMQEGLTGPLTPLQQAYLDKMMAGSETLLSLVNDLLDMSRIQAGKFSISPKAVSLSAVIAEVLCHMAPLVEQKGHALVTEVPEDLPMVQADQQRLGQVVMNLVGNAIKFTPPGGDLAVQARVVVDPDGTSALRCEVRDNGVGVAEADLAKLFQPFGLLDSTSTRTTRGTGLGLSISRALVEAHGGRVGVESTLGQGSCFWFTLPL
jgi:PAS domain S-box-containing protein